MKLIEILKMIERHYNYEDDMPVKDYDIRPDSVFTITLCFMSEEETWVTVPITHPILRQYYYADVSSASPDGYSLQCWIAKKDWFPPIPKWEGKK